jgi:uncharacterized membrane protein
MPNLFYMTVSFVYHVALALWIGGAIALGALTAPELFRRLQRADAGAIFGTILRRFSRIRLGAVIVALIAAGVKHVQWERHASSSWIAARWVLLALLSAIVLYEIGFLEPVMGRLRGRMRGEDDPARAEFMRLHRRSEGLMKMSLIAALGAVFLA